MSGDQDQIDFAAGDASHPASSAPRWLKCHMKCHEAMDNIEELKEFIKEQERAIAFWKHCGDTDNAKRRKADADLRAMTADRDAHKATADSLAADLKTVKTVNDRLKLEISQLHNSLKAMTVSRNEWSEKAELREVELANEILCVATLQEQVRELEDRIAGLKQSHVSKESAEMIGQLTKERDSWKDTACSWKDTSATQSNELRTANHAIDRLKAESQSLRNSLADSDASQWKGLAESRLKVMGELNATITDLQRHIRAKDTEITSFRTSLAEVTKHREGLLQSQDADRNSINEKYKEIEELKKSLTTMTASRDAWKEKATDRFAAIGQQSVSITDLERTLAATKSANEYLKRDLEEATAENAEYAKEIRDLQVLVNDLNVKFHNLKTSYSDTDGWVVAGSRLETIESQAKQIRNLDADVARLTKEVSLAYGNGENARQWIIDEQGKEVSRLKGEIKTLQDGLEDMRARYIAAQKARVEMGQFHAGFGTDSVVIPKGELRDKLNSLRMADPAFASWYSLRDMALGITKYFEEKIGQKS